MKKIIAVCISVLFFFTANGQRAITTTESFIIQGKVKKERTYTLTELDTFPQTDIGQQIVYNHKGEIKDTIQSMKGVPLKTLFEKIEFDYDKPKALNEFYFVFIASDGYKVVFSWNEIFNSEAGNNFFIITEKEGKRGKEINEGIRFTAAKDLKTGRRNIKALERIIVKQVE